MLAVLAVLAVLAALAVVTTACVNGDGVHGGAAPQRPSPLVSTVPATGSGPPDAQAAPSGASPSISVPPARTGMASSSSSSASSTSEVTPSPDGCVSASVTITMRPGELAAQRLCVKVGTAVTVIVPPGPSGAWPGPRTSGPMSATITATTTDPDGTGRVTLRAARPGVVVLTWGTEGSNTLSLRLDVAAFQIP
ncbi:hypothetical protein ABZ934_31260 [Streptomyces sp. NPDC046557]|uniref:hypothetical protein n=1 Tax=Streptomyces sp. NPDC046557 TaxID=3155372 RepID=UPI003402A354